MAPLAVAVCTSIKVIVPPLAPAETFVLYSFAVALSAWLGGRLGGALATILITVIVPWLAWRATGEVTFTLFARVVIFAMEGTAITCLIYVLRMQQVRLREVNAVAEAARASLEEESRRLLAAEHFARETAQQAARSKDRFLAFVSHELRGPLTAILGWSQMLTPTSDSILLAQGLGAIEENARAQARLVEELLDYSRITSGHIELEKRAVSVASVVRSAVDAFTPEAQRKQLEIRSALPGSDVLVEGDERRLRQVFMNVIQNAIRYTDSGYVDIRSERQNGRVRIAISDTGRGIAPSFLPQIFDRFSQESSDGAGRAGLGLGLAIVRELVTLHGGKVEATSEGPGKGASFLIELPVAGPAAFEHAN